MNISKNTSSASTGKAPLQSSGTRVAVRSGKEKTIETNEVPIDFCTDVMSLNTQKASLQYSVSLDERFVTSICNTIEGIEELPKLSSKVKALKAYLIFCKNQIEILEKKIKPLIEQMGYNDNTESIDLKLGENPHYLQIQKESFLELSEIARSLASSVQLSKAQANERRVKDILDLEDLEDFKKEIVITSTKGDKFFQEKYMLLDLRIKDIIENTRKSYNKHKKEFDKDLTELNIRNDITDYMLKDKKYVELFKRVSNKNSLEIQAFNNALEEAAERAIDELMCYGQEKQETENPKTLSSSLSSTSKKEAHFKKHDIKNFETNIETASSSEPSREQQYDEKLFSKWKEYFKKTDYRKGSWSGKGGISIPLMGNYFSSQIGFTLSTKEIIAHLGIRHPDIIKELTEKQKQTIKDADGFQSVISKYRLEIHNLISKIALQLSQAEAVIYKSPSHKDAETGAIISKPTIMVKGKNEAGDMMLSAWGLYEAEKDSGIKLHLLSYYPDDSPNRSLLKNAIKISDFADKVHEEMEAPVAQPLDDANLIALFEETNIANAKQKFDAIKKGKGKKKKS